MTLSLCYPWFSRFSFPSPYKYSSRNTTSLFYLLFTTESTSLKNQPNFILSASNTVRAKASLSESGKDVADNSISELLDDDDELINRVSALKDADEALQMIAERTKRSSGVVTTSDCCSIISAALDRNNADLALSIFYAMRSSFDTAIGGKGLSVGRWRWSRPDVNTYTLLVQGLAASLKVSDALRIIANVCRVGVSPAEEVPFGKIVRCPSCMIAVAVAQPQHGLQIVSCSKCRYQYELVSGNIVNIESEEIRISSCRTQHGSSCMEKGAKIPSNNETKHSCCCSLHCGTDPIWDGSNTQICH